jgi:hypothetical protein
MAIQMKNLADLNNANLLVIFMNAWNGWAQSVTSGKIPATNPPQPPVAWVVTTDANGFPQCVPGTTPVCAQPPLPVVPPPAPATPPPNTIDIGDIIQSGPFFAVGPMDSWPVGKPTPPNAKSADGVVGTFLRLGSPLGPGWYEKVG